MFCVFFSKLLLIRIFRPKYSRLSSKSGEKMFNILASFGLHSKLSHLRLFSELYIICDLTVMPMMARFVYSLLMKKDL